MSLTTPTSQSPIPTITIHQVTEDELPTLIPLQFLCFSHTILIEQIAKPDTPSNREAELENHRRHFREDKDIRIVKAMAHTPDASTADGQRHELVGFSMFYYPVKADDRWIYPVPLRDILEDADTREPDVPTPTSTAAAIAAGSVPAGPGATEPAPSTVQPDTGASTATVEPSMPMSQTNIPSLRAHRKRTIFNHLGWSPSSASTSTLPPIGYVRYMCVHPSFRRYGIGSRLMDWGCSRFDEVGVPAYLEATVEGEPMYRRFGFEEIGVQVLEVYGDDGESVVDGDRYKCMWREPRNKE